MKNFFCLSVLDEYNNNEKESLPQDILKILKSSGVSTAGHGSYGGGGGGHGLQGHGGHHGAGDPDSASQISRSLPRQDTSDTSVDLNIFNDEMRLRNNIENMYKKGKKSHTHLFNLDQLVVDR